MTGQRCSFFDEFECEAIYKNLDDDDDKRLLSRWLEN